MLKAELHAHLEGTITPAFARTLASRNNIALPDGLIDDNEQYVWKGFDAFLNCYDRVAALIASEQDYSDLTYDYLARAAADDCIYVELICSADHGAAAGLSYAAMNDAIADGIDRARDNFGIEARMLQSVVRHYGVEAALKTARTVASQPHPYVTGFQMAGAEAAHSAAEFAPAFALAEDAGLGLTAHAGEVCGPESIWAVLENIPGITRIGHGVRCVEDFSLMAELAAHDIVLEVCPSSNIAIGVFDSLAEHSLPQIVQSGIKCTLASDDPPFFGTTIGNEYTIAAEQFEFSDEQLRDFTRTAIDAAFVDEQTRMMLLERLETE